MSASRRRLLYWSLGLVILVVVLLGSIPRLATFSPWRDRLLGAVVPKIHGSISSGGAALGWFAPVVFENIEIRDPEGELAVRIPRLEGEIPLWRYLLWLGEGDTLHFHGPEIFLFHTERGWNVAQIFAEMELPDLPLNIYFRDTIISIRGREQEAAWELPPLDLTGRIVPSRFSQSGEAEFVAGPVRLLEHVALTPEMSRELLRPIVPLPSGVSNLSGECSVEMDEIRVPGGDVRRVAGQGRLTLHRLDLHPGALLQGWGLHKVVPKSIRLAENLVVEFRLVEGRLLPAKLEGLLNWESKE